MFLLVTMATECPAHIRGACGGEMTVTSDICSILFRSAGALAQMVLQEMHGGVPQTPDWLPRSFTTRV